ncbi:MAG TPA: glycosyltransferase [Mycobacterium sp.]|nr:glycosyltransferase [Mycobacterium sp.]
MIGYYIHHQGFGHLARAMSICEQLRYPATALSSMDIAAPHPFAEVVKLPRDDHGGHLTEPTAHGALHWAPLHHNGFQERMNTLARWIADVRPAAFVTDVSVEIAAFVRLLGVPVIVVALPGKRFDAPHAFVHQLADHIIAGWPRELYLPPWLQPHVGKTSFVGGISRFDGRSSPAPQRSENVRVLVLAGADEHFGGATDECAAACPGTTWTPIGGTDRRWVADPWPRICAADVVVTHAGQSAVADVAAARRRAVVIPQSRPYDEQSATATVLRQRRLATVAIDWPDVRAWPGLIAQALAADPEKWSRWQVAGAASRAARAIEATAQDGAVVSAS